MNCLLLVIILLMSQLIAYHTCAKKKHNFKSAAYWKQLAKSQGLNVCVREIIPKTGTGFDRAWTGGSYCGTKTVVKFQCCEGFGMVQGEQGCPLVKPQASFLETAETVGAGMFLKLQETSGLSRWLSNGNQGAVTILAPSNQGYKLWDRRLIADLNYRVQRTSSYLESPPLLLHHTLDSRISLKSLPSDSLVTSFYKDQPVRFNVYPNELITVNCVPIIETDIQTTQGILHIIEAPLEDKSLYTIAEVISQHRELRRLGTFIAQANFEKTLRLSGPFTFFAPTDEAFNSISDDKLQFLLYNEQALQALMNHHLVEGVYCLSALHNTTLNTKAKTIVRSRCTLKGTKVSGASISRNNIMASNGVIHLIDQVLIPRRAKSLMDLLDDLGLTKLKSLLPTAGLQSAFKGRGTITVFAPSNQALEAFGNSTVFNSQMEIRTLLAGHMVSGRLLTRNLLDKQELQTLSHHKVLRTKIYNSRTMVNDGVIVKPDIEGSNGVIHIVNKVLKPPKFSIIQYLQSQGTYSRFLSALNRTSPSLIELLESDNAPFTVFAVTDASIDSWSADLFTYDRMMADTRIVNSVTAAGKAILITDCNSRIGYALARQLDDLGFTVYAGFLNVDNGSSKKLKEESSGRLHVLQLDVTSENQILAAYDYVRENLPHEAAGLWAVVNSATWASFGEVEWVPYTVYRQATEVNLLSLIRITQIFLPLVRKTKGRIINIVSILGRIASPLRSPYCTVKFGVEAFSDCLRLEMRRWGVDVVVVEPGDYTTGKTWYTDKELLAQAKFMWKTMSDETRSEYGEDYFEQSVRSLETYTKGEETDLTPVLRSLSDAVIRTFPLARYTSVTRAEKLQAFVSDHLPRSVYDIIYT